MLDDLIIETNPIDTNNIYENLSEEEKVIIDWLESTSCIIFYVHEGYVHFYDESFYKILGLWIFNENKLFTIIHDHKFFHNETIDYITELSLKTVEKFYKIKQKKV